MSGRANSPGRHLARRELFRSLFAPATKGSHWIRLHRTAMACRFEVLLDSEDAPFVPAARGALEQVDAIEAALTFFQDASELQRLNREAATGAAPASAQLFALLVLSRELHALTAGAFDPTSTPLSRAWGFLSREGREPAAAEIEAARARVGMEQVGLDEARRTVRFARPDVELNLGSIGKGWAIDRIADGLRARGISRALVSAGGSSQRVWGDRPWEVALAPGGERCATLRLSNTALGTSGAGEQHFESHGRRYGHLIDPRTGWPASGVRSASVIADDTAVADALATACFVGGPQTATAVSAARPGTVAILVLDAEPGVLRVFGERAGAVIEPAPAFEMG